MKSKITLIEPLSIKEVIDLAFLTWNPILEKNLIDYFKLPVNNKIFLCRFCHEYSLIESSELTNDSGIMNILSPSGKPTELKSNLPLFIKILGAAIVELGDTVNFHITSSPYTRYIITDTGTVRDIKINRFDINKMYDASPEFNMTNYHEVYENIFIKNSINELVESFKKYEDVVVYPAWHFNEILIAEATTVPKYTIRLSGRFSGIENYNEVEPIALEIEQPNTVTDTLDIKESNSKFVGCWELGGPEGILLHLKKRPNRFHIFMCKLLLGILWIDKNNEEEVNA